MDTGSLAILDCCAGLLLPAGTGLVELHLDAGCSWPPLQLAGEALPASLTQLQLKMVQVTDTVEEPLGTAAAVRQAAEHGLPWAGPPLQLLQLKELLLGGVSSWMPASAFRCESSTAAAEL
jgi:hypothetical protein